MTASIEARTGQDGDAPATPVFAAPIRHPSAWTVADFRSPADYSVDLDAMQLRDIAAAMRRVKAAGISLDGLQPKANSKSLVMRCSNLCFLWREAFASLVSHCRHSRQQRPNVSAKPTTPAAADVNQPVTSGMCRRPPAADHAKSTHGPATKNTSCSAS